MTKTLTIDDLMFHVHRSNKRKTVGITIERDGSLVMNVPVDCTQDTMKSIGREKRLWIFSRLAERELLFQPKRIREFVSGESFFYLGRSYRLLLEKKSKAARDVPPLQLHEGRFKLYRAEVVRAEEHLRNWYIAHGQKWVERRVSLLAPRIGVKPKALILRDLGYRWGSCGQNGTVYLHWRAVCLPPRVIEYLVAHELVHMIQPYHNDEFYIRLERVIPDYLSRKQYLAENGGRYV